MSYVFEVGKTYRNRVGEYTVQDIDGEWMTIRYVGGATLDTSVAIQGRIWENIQFEEQMVREDERQKLAREERLEARRRTARAKKAATRPSFAGFEESDFEPRKRGLAWSGRVDLGKVLAFDLRQGTKQDYGHWIVPRQSEVHVAQKKSYDRDTRDTNAAFFVNASEQGVTYGFRVGKPDGKEKANWPWSKLMKALAGNEDLRSALHSAMEAHEVSLDVYTTDVGYGQVGQVTAQESEFLYQHETAEQAITQEMNWDALVDYLRDVAPGKRSELYLRRRLSTDAALQARTAVVSQIGALLEVLVPVYNASIGA